MNPRFLCTETMSVGASLQLPADIAHHAVRVLRLRVGDALVLFDGRGGEYRARLESVAREVSATIESYQAVERESPLQLTLVQALPSGDKMDWIVEKAVELGVTAIVPVIAERSVVRLAGERADKRHQHLCAVARAACEQCGRNRVPQVEPILPLNSYLGAHRVLDGLHLVLAPEADCGLADLAAPTDGATLLVGPEGGWSDGELRAIRSAGWRALALGPRILRTETAGLAAVAAIQSWWGDLGRPRGA